MDAKTTFLHGDLEEEIYTKQREGFAMKGKKELVCSLKRSLYGLKQSPRTWYQNFDTYMLDLEGEKLIIVCITNLPVIVLFIWSCMWMLCC
jgi:hypothetical protein